MLFATSLRDPKCPSPVDEVNGGTHRAGTGCVGVTPGRMQIDSRTAPILEQRSLAKVTCALIVMHASLK